VGDIFMGNPVRPQDLEMMLFPPSFVLEALIIQDVSAVVKFRICYHDCAQSLLVRTDWWEPKNHLSYFNRTFGYLPVRQ